MENPRELTVVRVERVLLAARYLGYFLLLTAYAIGFRDPALPPLFPVTVGAIIHNAFAHYVLHTRRYYLFLSPGNFVLHLAKISLLVATTGGDRSPLAYLYLVLIVGYAMCSTRFRSIFLVTITCAGAYSMVVLYSWWIHGFQPPYNPIALQFFGIFLCGWMMNTMGEMLRTMELEAQTRAQALASSEATLRTILNSTPSPILVCEENELIADANNPACEFLDVRREELVGQRVRAFLFDDGTLPNKFAALRSRGEYHGDALVLCSDGQERDVVMHVRSFFRDNQRFFVAMLQDVTEQKNLQEANRQATQRLESANRELQKVDELRTEFFRTVSQRLRSPLSAIFGYVEMLLHEELGELNPEQRRALQNSRRSAQRVFSMLDETTALGAAKSQSKGKGNGTREIPAKEVPAAPEMAEASDNPLNSSNL